MSETFLGIDIGRCGALALFRGAQAAPELRDVFDMPCLNDGPADEIERVVI